VTAWLQTPMSVTYAQVLGAGVVTLALLWLSSSLALWLFEMGRHFKTQRSIEHHQARTIEVLQDSVRHLKDLHLH